MIVATIRKHVYEDDPQVVELLNLSNPDLPRQTVEEYRASLKALPEGVPLDRWVAEADGRVVGASFTLSRFWTGQKGSYTGEVHVLDEYRRQGNGSVLYDALFESAEAFDAERIFSYFREGNEEGKRFAAQRGFVETGTVSRLSRLDVTGVAYDEGYQTLAGRLEVEGIRVKTLRELGHEDEDVLRSVHDVDMQTAADEPASETFSVSYELWREMLYTQPGYSPDAMWVALAGDRPIGLTKLRVEGHTSAWHSGMGVLREFRGRGVARLLKQRTIEWAKQNGIERLYTGNDVNNPRMYSINIRLGYKPLPGSIEVMNTPGA